MEVKPEDTFRTLFRHMRDGFAYCRMLFEDGVPKDFVYLAVNDAFERLTGLHDVTGRRISQVIPGIVESDPELFETYGRVASTGQSEHFETHVKSLDMWFDVSVYSPAKDHFVAVFDVITARKRTEMREEFIRRIFELPGEVGDERKRIRDILLLIQDFSGCEAVGLRLRDGDDYPYYESDGFVAGHVELENSLCSRDELGNVVREPDGTPALDCMCGNILCGRFDPAQPFFTPGGSFWTGCTTELLASTTEADRQARTRNRCNGEGYESVALIPLRTGNGNVGLLQLNDRRRGRFSRESVEFYEPIAQIIGAVLSRVRAERAVRESEQLLQSIIEGTTDAVFVKDRLGRYRLVNSATGRFVGKRPEDCIGQDDTNIFSPAEAAIVMDSDRMVMNGGTTVTYEEAITAAGGEHRIFLTTKGPFFDSSGKPAGLFGIARDITDFKQAELERRALEHQLFQAQKLDAIGQLAGGIAHDFNNILAAIMMELTTLDLPTVGREELEEAIGNVLSASERAAALAKKLLLFGRRQAMETTTRDLSAIVGDLSKLLRRMLGEKVELVFEGSNEPLWFVGDASMVEQVVVNLCLNARDAMPNGGRLRLATTCDNAPTQDGDPELCLAVSDNGNGIAPTLIDRIFEPFFTTKELGKGTGLGLSIVHGIVSQHHGRITVESQVGQGSTFRVFLPAVAPKSKRGEGPRLPVADRGSETILLVEDEAIVRHLAARALRRSGYDVIEAEDGPSAIRTWNQVEGTIDLLLTDMVMPGGISGIDLLNHCRRSSPDLKAIVVSGYLGDIEGDVERVTYLPKPFEFARLINTVRTCLDAASR